ncbi:MAG: hypothetical protein M1825_003160 [Sarcosagium campestre]|nr:MAG: hypothetical protein M1825_003160 [Sarcosagium campestre]
MADEADQADKVRAEAKLSRFEFEQVLNQDQGGRRVTLQGRIDDQSCILTIERCAFPTSPSDLSRLPSSLQRVQNLSSNDIYAWYLASCGGQSSDTRNEDAISTPDVKVNLIHPCTEAHIKKYSRQGVRMVTETPHIYRERIQPYMQRKREEGRLNWVWNIIEGRTEQEDVILRVSGGEEGFLVLPDLNWDRITLTSLHLLAIVERRDIWSLRDLKKRHIPWLQHMREKLLDATPNLYPGIEKDQLKLYIHCACCDLSIPPPHTLAETD